MLLHKHSNAWHTHCFCLKSFSSKSWLFLPFLQESALVPPAEELSLPAYREHAPMSPAPSSVVHILITPKHSRTYLFNVGFPLQEYEPPEMRGFPGHSCHLRWRRVPRTQQRLDEAFSMSREKHCSPMSGSQCRLHLTTCGPGDVTPHDDSCLTTT